MALPIDLEEIDPGIQHIGAQDAPTVESDGVSVSLLVGTMIGLGSPRKLFAETHYADVILENGARYIIDSMHVERAMYVVVGPIETVGQGGKFGKEQVIVFQPGAEIVMKTNDASRLMLLGGEPLLCS